VSATAAGRIEDRRKIFWSLLHLQSNICTIELMVAAAAPEALAAYRAVRDVQDRIAWVCGQINALQGELVGLLGEVMRRE
jgi:hypothetical protein